MFKYLLGIKINSTTNLTNTATLKFLMVTPLLSIAWSDEENNWFKVKNTIPKLEIVRSWDAILIPLTPKLFNLVPYNNSINLFGKTKIKKGWAQAHPFLYSW